MKMNGEKMRQIREKKGLRHVDVAAAADLSERRIQQIEAGKISNINLNVAKGIAACLGVSLEKLA
jgi:transcriptional regulator with XRE-family HTH domain